MDISKRNYRRILFLLSLWFLIFCGLAARLIRVQFIDGPRLTALACKQRRDYLLRDELRGGIYDRKGIRLRGPKTECYLLIKNTNGIGDKLKTLNPFFSGRLLKEYQDNRHKTCWVYSKPLAPVQLKLINRINARGFRIFKGVSGRSGRESLAWHLLGSFNRSGELSGLEASYQPILKNSPDSLAVFREIDGIRNYLPGTGLRLGKDNGVGRLILTLDRKIQQIVETVMDREKMTGAVVILDVKSGEILAMASRPTINLRNLKLSIGNADTPFINRAIAAYPPGSIFKLVLASAGLDTGEVHPETVFNDSGFFRIADRKWFCTTSNGAGHGRINLIDSLAYSCNPVFIEIALKLGPEPILRYAEKFGLGAPCNIGLADESWGRLPAGIGLSLGEEANLALGQELIAVTPLQIASLVQTIANNGMRRKPELVKGFFDKSGLYHSVNKVIPKRVIKVETAAQLRQMMAAVTAYGTGTGARPSAGAAGKTGTAQTNANRNRSDHAWFAGYTPLVKPRYVGVVFCEKGVSGGETAAPIFREIMEKINIMGD